MSAASQETLSSLWEKQKNFFSTGITKPISFRKTALSRLAQGIRARQNDILTALQTDLHKCEAEARLTELYLIFQEIRHALRHVSHWSRPKWAAPSLSQLPGRSFTQLEPYGTTLILAPWNYPFQLSLVPLIHAIAAGNCAVVKPSEHAPASAQVIQEILKDCFPPAYVTAVPGGRDESSALLDQPFDFIFFTGGETVGRLVLEKAARHLTPVCLELGGKSPCIVDATAMYGWPPNGLPSARYSMRDKPAWRRIMSLSTRACASRSFSGCAGISRNSLPARINIPKLSAPTASNTSSI